MVINSESAFNGGYFKVGEPWTRPNDSLAP